MTTDKQTFAFFGMAAEVEMKIDGVLYQGPVSFICYDEAWQKLNLDTQCAELVSIEDLFPGHYIEIVEDNDIAVGFVDFAEDMTLEEWEAAVQNFTSICIARGWKYKTDYCVLDELVNNEFFEVFYTQEIKNKSLNEQECLQPII